MEKKYDKIKIGDLPKAITAIKKGFNTNFEQAYDLQSCYLRLRFLQNIKSEHYIQPASIIYNLKYENTKQ